MPVAQLLEVVPPTPARMSRAEVVASQRDRMVRAMAEAAAEKGYANTVVADVVSRAGVSRKTFYEHFARKEDCFLAAYEACVDGLRARLTETLDPDLPAAEQGRRMLDAYLEALAAEPRVAKTYLVEVYAAGPEASARRRAVLGEFAALLRTLHERLRDEGVAISELRPIDYEMLVGSIVTTVATRVATGEGAQLPELAPDLLRFLMRALDAEEQA